MTCKTISYLTVTLSLMNHLNDFFLVEMLLTHWGWVTHICVSKLTSIASDNGLSPGQRQAIIWNTAGILFIGPLGTNFSEILIEIQTFSLKKIRLKMSSAKCCSFRLGLNVLTHWPLAEREREIKFIGLFENRGHRGPYSPYKPFNHNLYIGIIIFPHIDNPQSTGYNQPKKKNN